MSVTKRTGALVALIGCCLALALSACGSSSSSSSATTNGGASTPAQSTTSSTSTVSHPNVKFAAHAGVAFFMFHRWIYKPFKAGDFSHPLSHKLAVAKAIVAAGVGYHELKQAIDAAKASPQLSSLAAPLAALATKFTGLVGELKGGGLTSGSLDDIQNSISSITSGAHDKGTVIKDVEQAL